MDKKLIIILIIIILATFIANIIPGFFIRRGHVGRGPFYERDMYEFIVAIYRYISMYQEYPPNIRALNKRISNFDIKSNVTIGKKDGYISKYFVNKKLNQALYLCFPTKYDRSEYCFSLHYREKDAPISDVFSGTYFRYYTLEPASTLSLFNSLEENMIDWSKEGENQIPFNGITVKSLDFNK